jgi:hypothetical protein
MSCWLNWVDEKPGYVRRQTAPARKISIAALVDWRKLDVNFWLENLRMWRRYLSAFQVVCLEGVGLVGATNLWG